MDPSRKTAIVLFNLGGPDRPEAIEPFLFNLFNDPAIIRLPGPLRWLVAKLISSRRAPTTTAIYEHLGGRSPLVPLTEDQGAALEAALSGYGTFKTFLAMRYWTPFASDAVKAAKDWGAEQIVLLPLYPQYSTTTTESSMKDWEKAAKAGGLDLPTAAVCCYPTAPGFIEAHVQLLKEALGSLDDPSNARVLFSAHGLPKRVVDGGDPYKRQVEQTCAAVVDQLNMEGLDWVTCYQSRVGPMEWIGPSTEDEIARAGSDGKAIVLTPIAFVSEHSETLVELDIEYGHLAAEKGVPAYVRVPALGTHPSFIGALAERVLTTLQTEGVVCPEDAAGNPCTQDAGLTLAQTAA